MNLRELGEQVAKFVREHITDDTNENKEMDHIVDAFIALDLLTDGQMIYVVRTVLREMFGKSDMAHQRAIDFLVSIKARKICPVLDGFKLFMNGLDTSQISAIAKQVASILYRAVAAKLISLQSIAFYTRNGDHYPVFLLVLKQLEKIWGTEAVVAYIEDNQINWQATLPLAYRVTDRIAKILEKHNLDFLAVRSKKTVSSLLYCFT